MYNASVDLQFAIDFKFGLTANTVCQPVKILITQEKLFGTVTLAVYKQPSGIIIKCK